MWGTKDWYAFWMHSTKLISDKLAGVDLVFISTKTLSRFGGGGIEIFVSWTKFFWTCWVSWAEHGVPILCFMGIGASFLLEEGKFFCRFWCFCHIRDVWLTNKCLAGFLVLFSGILNQYFKHTIHTMDSQQKQREQTQRIPHSDSLSKSKGVVGRSMSDSHTFCTTVFWGQQPLVWYLEIYIQRKGRCHKIGLWLSTEIPENSQQLPKASNSKYTGLLELSK